MNFLTRQRAADGDMQVQLPCLKNADEADDSFIEDSLCKMTPSIDFFAVRGTEMNFAAIALCGECPVSVQCLEYAMITEQEWGVWGGTQQRERTIIIRNKRMGIPC